MVALTALVLVGARGAVLAAATIGVNTRKADEEESSKWFLT
jgi:hypothetical protein